MTDVAQATPHTTATELLHLLSQRDCHAVPVLEDGRLVGIVTQTDLLAVLAKHAAQGGNCRFIEICSPPVSLYQSSPRKGWTYCSAMSQGKKIQVSWLTSVT